MQLLYGIIVSAQVGIGVDTPTATLDIDGNLRVRSLPEEVYTPVRSVLVADTNGNVKSIQKTKRHVYTSIPSGETVTTPLASVEGGQLVTVRSLDACGRDMMSVYIVARDALVFLNGQVENNQQSYTRGNLGKRYVVTSTSIGLCQDGTMGSFDYTLDVNAGGTQLTLTNDSADARFYIITTSLL